MRGFELLAVLSNPQFATMLRHGATMTLVVAVGSWCLAMVLALILWVSLMVPIPTGTTVPGFVTMLVTLVLYEGAFSSEVVRGGIVVLGRGQMEAVRSHSRIPGRSST